ncbi:MAG: hypothetical protein IIU26_04980 [Clostridium sp.]|nr:hypothetical protein [Clostridium sp.]
MHSDEEIREFQKELSEIGPEGRKRWLDYIKAVCIETDKNLESRKAAGLSVDFEAPDGFIYQMRGGTLAVIGRKEFVTPGLLQAVPVWYCAAEMIAGEAEAAEAGRGRLPEAKPDWLPENAELPFLK